MEEETVHRYISKVFQSQKLKVGSECCSNHRGMLFVYCRYGSSTTHLGQLFSCIVFMHTMVWFLCISRIRNNTAGLQSFCADMEL